MVSWDQLISIIHFSAKLVKIAYLWRSIVAKRLNRLVKFSVGRMVFELWAKIWKNPSIFVGFRPSKIYQQPEIVINLYNSYMGCLMSIQMISSLCIFIGQQKFSLCLGYKICQIFFSFSFVNLFIFYFTFFLVLRGGTACLGPNTLRASISEMKKVNFIL